MTTHYEGRLVVRLLPEGVNGDYEQAKLSLPMADAQVMGLIKHLRAERSDTVGVHKKGFFDPKWINDWNLKECGSIALDIFVPEMDLTIHMNRSPSEVFGKVTQRIGISLSKKIIKKVKGSNKKTEVLFSFTTCGDGETTLKDITDQTLHSSVWIDVLLLNAVDQFLDLSFGGINLHLHVDVCPPTLVFVKTFENFGACLFQGIPLVLKIDTLFSSQTTVDWYADNQQVHTGSLCYTPTPADIGKSLHIVVAPSRNDCVFDCSEAFTFPHKVEERPRNAILELRSLFSQPRCAQAMNNLRILSYNILADLNASSGLAQTSFYPYCDNSVIAKERRFPLVLYEILQYQADIICLQEVDYFVFYGLMHPVLKYHGYEGFFTSKQGTREGVAMFWSLAVFESVPQEEMMGHAIRDLFDKNECLSDWASMQDVMHLLDQHSELNSIMREKLGHVMQTVTLTQRNTPSKKVVIGNTHLFFHPMASHIRLMQLLACFHQMQIERQGKDHSNHDYPIVFCGDLNSSPMSGAARLMLERAVIEDSISVGVATGQGSSTTWKHLHSFSWGHEYKDPENIPHEHDAPKPPKVQLPESFPNLVSGYSDLPAYTHYIKGFAACLDYIVASKDVFEPIACAEMPSKEILSCHVAMPSEVLPSDHVCLVCDFQWNAESSVQVVAKS